MQPIERIGVFALLALAVMVVAVWQFDSQPDGPVTEVAAMERSTETAPSSSKPTVHVPQLGQTTAANRNKKTSSKPAGSSQLSPSYGGKSDWKQRKAQRDAAKKEKEAAANAGRGLPISTPAQLLTPAPKRTISPSTKPARHVPSGKPAARLSEQVAGDRVNSKTTKYKPQTTVSSKTTQAASAAKRDVSVPDYTVQRGDTLSEISLAQLGTSTRWREIEELNGVSASALSVGMELRMPARHADAGVASSSKSTQPKAAKPAAKSDGTSYEVSDGDSLWLIAQRQLGDGNRWAEIASLNSEINPNKLVVGTALAMPTGSAPVATKKPVQTAAARTSSSSQKPRVR